MSVNLYLCGTVLECAGYDRNAKTFYGRTVLTELRPHIIWSENDDVPNAWQPYIDGISWYLDFPKTAGRETGVYRNEDCECTVEVNLSYGRNQSPVYRMKCTGTNLPSMRQLVHQIKTGVIRPDESFEAPQGGASRAEMEHEIQKLKSDLESVRIQSEDYNAAIMQLRAQASKDSTEIRKLKKTIDLVKELVKTWSMRRMPWIKRRAVIKSLEDLVCS